jgi:hypothetical protein
MVQVGRRTLSVVVLIVLAAGGAHAGTVYRWTDENGTVHFGDVPPPHVKQFQTQTLPDAPPPVAAGTPAEGTQKAGETPAATGAARLVLLDQHADAVSPGVQAIRGKVRNEGGSDAHDVSIAIVVTEPNQGEECMHERISVDPSTLAPGDEGSFDAQFENACFQGPTQIGLHAEWR